jgi:hypothetical protein
MSFEERKAMREVVLSSWTRAHKNLLMMIIILSTKLLEKRTVDIYSQESRGPRRATGVATSPFLPWVV